LVPTKAGTQTSTPHDACDLAGVWLRTAEMEISAVPWAHLAWEELHFLMYLLMDALSVL